MRWIGIVAAGFAANSLAFSQTPPTPTIAIDAPAAGPWAVRYVAPVPIRVLAFARSPDRSRAADWIAPPGFEITHDAGGEVVRRRDGTTFTTVTLRVPPVYRDLPKDYAPFSRFGDGGVLFHSGRFFACAVRCSDDARWRMTIRAPGRAVLVNGRRSDGVGDWRDGGQGRNVYVGIARPVATPDVLAVIDTALPPRIRTQLDRDLPLFMRFYAARLGAVPVRPMLFVSYDADHREGWGRQGGTLPGQVFTHFYGSGWPRRMASAEFAPDLGWHLAHEAAHIHQRQLTLSGEGGAWMHEGVAEAFAALAMRAQGDEMSVARKLTAARVDCDTATRDRSLTAAVAGGNFRAAYSCGLVIALTVHDAAKLRRPGADGLFTVWRRFAASAHGRDTQALKAYRTAVAAEAGICVATAMTAAVHIAGAATGTAIGKCAECG